MDPSGFGSAAGGPKALLPHLDQYQSFQKFLNRSGAISVNGKVTTEVRTFQTTTADLCACRSDWRQTVARWRVPPLYPLTRAHEVDSATRWGRHLAAVADSIFAQFGSGPRRSLRRSAERPALAVSDSGASCG